MNNYRKLGLLGIISLISYTLAVAISPIAYPGYDWMSMAVSNLSATDAPSATLYSQIGCLFGPCGIVSVTAVYIASKELTTKRLKIGILLFTAMEWVCMIGYSMFPWVESQPNGSFQNTMHLIVTICVVVLSIASLILIGIGDKDDKHKLIRLSAFICLAAMIAGAIGTNLLPEKYFGIAERFSTFSAVIYNAILGLEFYKGKLDN